MKQEFLEEQREQDAKNEGQTERQRYNNNSNDDNDSDGDDSNSDHDDGVDNEQKNNHKQYSRGSSHGFFHTKRKCFSSFTNHHSDRYRDNGNHQNLQHGFQYGNLDNNICVPTKIRYEF